MPRELLARCVILGGGGHARVVIDAMQAQGGAVICGVLEADPAKWGGEILGVPVLGGDDRLPQLASAHRVTITRLRYRSYFTAARTLSTHRRASASTAGSSMVSILRARMSTRPLTIVFCTSSPRAT